ncbi:class I tRNA ligase family protein [Paraburkholderia agricolaris]|uniref:Class I tRNA ligase family protein n=1 Tax=Paraburkholderia agricolaris TaxID=2152888 RepID=A0ABW9A184_9BURK
MKIIKSIASDLSIQSGYLINEIDYDIVQAGTCVTVALGSIRVGHETPLHLHSEREVFIAISGRASIFDGTDRIDFRGGDVVIADSLQSHTIRCEGGEPFDFATIYWFPNDSIVEKSDPRPASDRPVVVMSTPPTPNGDLHLGHLSGPYLGADAHTRYLRCRGRNAVHVTSSDDFQSYVVSLAESEQTTPEKTAAHYSAAIKGTLDLLDIHLDYYTSTATDSAYQDTLKAIAMRIADLPGVEFCASPATVHPTSGAYVYEATLSGHCPTCGCRCGGNICEECGFPNICTDIRDSKTRDGLSPLVKEIRRYHVSPSEFMPELLEHYRTSVMTPRLRRYTTKVLKDERRPIAISHPATWGVPMPTPDGSDQVLWVWVEMAFGLICAVTRLQGDRVLQEKNPESDRGEFPENIDIVHFFGFDNSFYHTIIFPTVYRLLYGRIPSNITYVSNEFYLLDGRKFSTSRRHAVWGKEILEDWSSDAVRFFLAKTRPEMERTNFTMNEFTQVVTDELHGTWQRLFDEANEVCARHYGGCAPVCGTWVSQHVAFSAELDGSIKEISACYEAGSFSLREAVAGLSRLVEFTRKFASTAEFYRVDGPEDSFYRTSIALTLAAVRLVGRLSYPILPKFSARIETDLGFQSVGTSWPKGVQLIPGGQTIKLATDYFERTTM